MMEQGLKAEKRQVERISREEAATEKPQGEKIPEDS